MDVLRGIELGKSQGYAYRMKSLGCMGVQRKSELSFILDKSC